MGVFYETMPATVQEWILKQKVIWIASAPLSADGHVNVSPKGGSYFGIVDEKTFWYQDLTGSGVETLSHLLEPGNGRITVLLNAFEGPPRIVRLWGRGRPLEFGTHEYESFVAEHGIETIAGTRAVVVVDVHQVGTSCGFSVPFYEFSGFRNTLNEYFERRVANEEAGKKEDGIERYWAHKNSFSMDGLPGMRRGYETMRREGVKPIKKMVGPHAPPPSTTTTPRKASGTALVSSTAYVALFSFILGLLVAVAAMEYARGGLGRDLGAYRSNLNAMLKDLERGRWKN